MNYKIAFNPKYPEPHVDHLIYEYPTREAAAEELEKLIMRVYGRGWKVYSVGEISQYLPPYIDTIMPLHPAQPILGLIYPESDDTKAAIEIASNPIYMALYEENRELKGRQYALERRLQTSMQFLELFLRVHADELAKMDQSQIEPLQLLSKDWHEHPEEWLQHPAWKDQPDEDEGESE